MTLPKSDLTAQFPANPTLDFVTNPLDPENPDLRFSRASLAGPCELMFAATAPAPKLEPANENEAADEVCEDFLDAFKATSLVKTQKTDQGRTTFTYRFKAGTSDGHIDIFRRGAYIHVIGFLGIVGIAGSEDEAHFFDSIHLIRS